MRPQLLFALDELLQKIRRPNALALQQAEAKAAAVPAAQPFPITHRMATREVPLPFIAEPALPLYDGGPMPVVEPPRGQMPLPGLPERLFASLPSLGDAAPLDRLPTPIDPELLRAPEYRAVQANFPSFQPYALDRAEQKALQNNPDLGFLKKRLGGLSERRPLAEMANDPDRAYQLGLQDYAAQRAGITEFPSAPFAPAAYAPASWTVAGHPEVVSPNTVLETIPEGRARSLEIRRFVPEMATVETPRTKRTLDVPTGETVEVPDWLPGGGLPPEQVPNLVPQGGPPVVHEQRIPSYSGKWQGRTTDRRGREQGGVWVEPDGTTFTYGPPDEQHQYKWETWKKRQAMEMPPDAVGVPVDAVGPDPVPYPREAFGRSDAPPQGIERLLLPSQIKAETPGQKAPANRWVLKGLPEGSDEADRATGLLKQLWKTVEENTLPNGQEVSPDFGRRRYYDLKKELETFLAQGDKDRFKEGGRVPQLGTSDLSTSSQQMRHRTAVERLANAVEAYAIPLSEPDGPGRRSAPWKQKQQDKLRFQKLAGGKQIGRGGERIAGLDQLTVGGIDKVEDELGDRLPHVTGNDFADIASGKKRSMLLPVGYLKKIKATKGSTFYIDNGAETLQLTIKDVRQPEVLRDTQNQQGDRETGLRLGLTQKGVRKQIAGAADPPHVRPEDWKTSVAEVVIEPVQAAPGAHILQAGNTTKILPISEKSAAAWAEKQAPETGFRRTTPTIAKETTAPGKAFLHYHAALRGEIKGFTFPPPVGDTPVPIFNVKDSTTAYKGKLATRYALVNPDTGIAVWITHNDIGTTNSLIRGATEKGKKPRLGVEVLRDQIANGKPTADQREEIAKLNGIIEQLKARKK